jgi:hypothetical protein
MKKNIYVFFLLMILFIPGQSCKDSSNPAGPGDWNYIFPLKIGNSWSYNHTNSFNNFRPDSIRHYLIGDSSITVNSSVTRDTLLNGIRVFELVENDGNYWNYYGYYANQDSGLFKYAYINSGQILPKSSGIRFFVNGKFYNNIHELIRNQEEKIRLIKTSLDSLQILSPPRKIYPYPVIIGSEWNLTSDYFRINKEIEGREIVETNSGLHSCYKIKWKYDMNNNGQWDDDIIVYEYYGAKGLVKRIIIVKDILVSTEHSPEGIGYVDFLSESTLKSCNF